ncbi:MAG: hypothetical protein ABIG28_03585, partial [archaeon]
PTECFESLGFKETPKDRTLNRDLERIGMKFQFIIEKYQQLIKKKGIDMGGIISKKREELYVR